jgi:hypothetical protein
LERAWEQLSAWYWELSILYDWRDKKLSVSPLKHVARRAKRPGPASQGILNMPD